MAVALTATVIRLLQSLGVYRYEGRGKCPTPGA
jgi:hypothetical protein